MQIHHAILLVRETCRFKHLSLTTEKTYTHWVRQYGLFLKTRKGTDSPPEAKMEAFLTHLAMEGVSASTQNQAFNALLFLYREALRVELGPVNALRAKRSLTLRDCPSPEEVQRLPAIAPRGRQSQEPLAELRERSRQEKLSSGFELWHR